MKSHGSRKPKAFLRVKKCSLCVNRMCHRLHTDRHDECKPIGILKRQLRATSSGRPGIRGPNSSDGLDSGEGKSKWNEDDDVGFVDANLNLGDSVIWACPSLWTGDWSEETLTLCILDFFHTGIFLIRFNK